MINSSNERPTCTSSRSIGELLASIKSEISSVVSQQIEIAKKEIIDLVVKAGATIVLALVLLFFLLSAWVMLLFALAWGFIALGLPAWAAFLIIAGILILLGGIAGLVAFLIVKKIKGPKTTIATSVSAVSALQGKGRVNAADYNDAFEELYGKQVEAK